MKKLLILPILLLGAWSVSAIDPDAARLLLGPPCTPESFRFFPPGSVDSESGPIYSFGSFSKTTSSEMGSCFFYTDKEGSLHNGSYLNFNDKTQTNLLFEGYSKQFPGKAYPGVSCDRLLPPDPDPGTKNPKGSAIYAQKGNYIFIIVSSYDIGRVTGDAEYACAQVKNASASKSPTPSNTLTPSPSASPKEPAEPIIDSFTPDIIPAGKNFEETNIEAIYEPLYLNFEIRGKNLDGARLTVDNIGTDNRPGIEFRDVETLKGGTYVRGRMISYPTAKQGATRITLTNVHGLSATYTKQVFITGTQYLRRTFGNSVLFKGDWEDFVPNDRIRELEARIREGLKQTELASYKALNIVPVVYESRFWNASLCGPDSKEFTLGGCASPANNIITIREISSMPMNVIILHEAAHKLDFFHRGQYRGIPGAPGTANSFFSGWKKSAGSVNTGTCPYLPLRTKAQWKDGSSSEPHCGMIKAYGASDLDRLYEDVATMTASYVFERGLWNAPEVRSDSRYNQKLQLLKTYGFLP